jgi:hypothetical protein
MSPQTRWPLTVAFAFLVSLPVLGVLRQPISAGARSNWSYLTYAYFPQAQARRACVTSTNQAQSPLASPETLCIRNWPGRGLDSYVLLPGSDETTCGNAGCVVRVRFDNGPIQSFTANSSDGSLFIRQPQLMLRYLEGSSSTTIELPTQDGEHALSFATRGLKWPPPPQAGDRVLQVVGYLVVLIWFATPLVVSLVTGDTLLLLKTYNRRFNPQAYWRGVRLWGFVFLCAFVVFSANLLLNLLKAA